MLRDETDGQTTGPQERFGRPEREAVRTVLNADEDESQSSRNNNSNNDVVVERLRFN